MKSVENICCDKPKPRIFPRLVRGERTGNIYLVDYRGGYYHDIILKVGHNPYSNQKIGTTDMYINFPPTMEDYDGTVTLSND